MPQLPLALSVHVPLSLIPHLPTHEPPSWVLLSWQVVAVTCSRVRQDCHTHMSSRWLIAQGICKAQPQQPSPVCTVAQGPGSPR